MDGRIIPLKGKRSEDGEYRHAIVDASDYELIAQRKWYCMSNGYATSNIPRNADAYNESLMHRLIMRPSLYQQVDHINGDRLDNRRSNLRITDAKGNAENRRGAQSNSGTGIRGVYYDKANNRYRAKVESQDKRYQRWFASLDDAAAWAESKRRELGFLDNSPSTRSGP